ncbi:membrane protein [Cohnella kolymensis]|uniref:Membrane protein n=1 Tax=Cohnella kolymensis TaxID=1590652 RepID=A0ABR5A6L3_9BACL|nr:DUF1146 family protein [Cohnella kolymensis]KIL36658.1 membrane protein [Cohnella kolymensis]
MDGSVLALAGWEGLLAIIVTLGCIAFSWVILQELNFDKLVRNPRSARARLLQLLTAIALGHLVARFVLDYWTWTRAINWLFRSG